MNGKFSFESQILKIRDGTGMHLELQAPYFSLSGLVVRGGWWATVHGVAEFDMTDH